MRGALPAVILAGGLARRMGGGDKPLLTVAGQPILSRVIERLAPQAAAIAINANGEPGRFANYHLPVIADPVPGRPGPLAGILAAVGWAAAHRFDAVVTAAGDTPFLPHDLVGRFLGAAGGGLAVAASHGEDGVLRVHPTFGLWPVRLDGALRESIASGALGVGAFAAAQGATTVVFPSSPFDPFFNVNTPPDRERAERLATRALP